MNPAAPRTPRIARRALRVPEVKGQPGRGLGLVLAIVLVAAVQATALPPRAEASTPMQVTTSPDARGQAAFRIGGQRWPGRPARIRYYNGAAQHAGSVRRAVAAWNASGARVKFVRSSKRRARLRIVYFRGPAAGSLSGVAGLGSLGYVRRGGGIRWAPVPGQPSVTRLPAGGGMLKLRRLKDPGRWAHLMDTVVAHELGHVLGLNHEDRVCSVMNSDGNIRPACKDPGALWRYRCRLVEPDDARGLVRRYGGKPRRARGPDICSLPAPPSPEGLTAALAGEDANGYPRVRLDWRNGFGGRGVRSVLIRWDRDSCPSADPGPPTQFSGSQEVEARPGAPGTALLSVDSDGRYCFRTWSQDDLDHRSGPREVWLDVPPSSSEF